ncbi:CocE/NonD family hydrolase [Lachnospiraceae bacterium 38-10]
MNREIRIFSIYVSGILYGKLKIGDGEPSLRSLDVFSGTIRDWKPLTGEENAFYQSFLKMDLAETAEKIGCYESRLKGVGEFVFDGERYTSEDGVHYLQRDVKFPNNRLMEEGRLIAVYCPVRELAAVLVEEGYEDRTIIKLWREAWPDEKLYPVEYLGKFDVPMRDGVKLSTDVYLPGGIGETVPAVLVRTPYGKEDGCEVYYRYVQRGYAVVIQDVRGRNLSEGEWMPNCHEVEDGDDTLNWIASRDWSARKVGMVGGSYLGFVQWAAAASGNPYLKALISVVCAGSAFVDLPRRGGSFTSGMLAWAFSVSQKKFCPELMERDDWEEVLKIRPLTDIPKRALGYEVPFLTKWLEKSDYNEFWRRTNWRERSVGARIPALIQSGWFDDNGMGTTEALEIVHDFPAGMRKVILGPWQHSGNSRYDMHGVSFGADALRFDLDLLYFRWFEYHLKGIENGIEKSAPVEYYTVGEERWKSAGNWPVPGTKAAALYLDGGGYANGSGGDGRLVFERPKKEGSDGYFYDPKEPAVHIVDMSENELEVPEDYTEEEKRRDVLCYTSDVLDRDMTVTGDMTAELYISSDAPDTDFIVRVTDVDETGRSVKLADGILSARYRGGFERAEFLRDGEIACLKIRTTKISNCFKKGHRIRVTITSGAENFIFPNSNTVDGYNSETVVTAHNRVHHGGEHASRLLVPVEEK